MDTSFSIPEKSLSPDQLAALNEWIKGVFEPMGIECDDVLAQYILVMANGGKTMGEVSAGLEDFVGAPECELFAAQLGDKLKGMTHSAAASSNAANPTGTAARVVSLKKTKSSEVESKMAQALTSSRSGDAPQQHHQKQPLPRETAVAGLDAPLSSGRPGSESRGNGRQHFGNKDRDGWASRLLDSALKSTVGGSSGSGYTTRKRDLHNNDRGDGGNKGQSFRDGDGFKRQRTDGRNPQDQRRGGRGHFHPPPPPPPAAAASGPPGVGAAGMMAGMMSLPTFNAEAMSQQMNAYANMMGFANAKEMMQMYNQSLMAAAGAPAFAGPVPGRGQYFPRGRGAPGRAGRGYYRGGGGRGEMAAGEAMPAADAAGGVTADSKDGVATATPVASSGTGAVSASGSAAEESAGPLYHHHPETGGGGGRGRGFGGRGAYRGAARGRFGGRFAGRGAPAFKNMTWEAVEVEDSLPSGR